MGAIFRVLTLITCGIGVSQDAPVHEELV